MFIEIIYLYVKHTTITSTEADIAYLMSIFITTTNIGTIFYFILKSFIIFKENI